MVENLKDLERLLKLCRKQGVLEINLGAISFKLGELTEKASHADTTEESDTAYADFPDGDLSAEELTFFASGGLPKDNPYREQ
jgi:hypothetical protein